MTVENGGYPPRAGLARTLGDDFRNTRTAAGASIDQVEADLRIKAKYIEAIEDGDAQALPSRAYTDGFLRNYATYLGLDPADAVRRFAEENGVTMSPSRAAVAAPMPKAQRNSLNGLSSTPPRRGVGNSLGRSFVALWPLVLVGGFAFVGYTGFVAARDAGLLPPQLGGVAQSDTQAPVEMAQGEPTSPVPAAPTAAAEKSEPARVAAADARRDLVGAEKTTGRPDSLSYARTGSTPYWQAKPPAVEPADGPVSEIEPEEAGLLRGPERRSADNTSRWSSSGATETPPSGFDASRIAAAAREALVGSLLQEQRDSAVPDPTSEPRTPEIAAVDVAPQQFDTPSLPSSTATPPTVETPDIAAATPETPTEPTFGIGPVVTQTVPAPAVPTNAPRRFALIAGADAWVQVTDASGRVTYTGILSPGEAYNIPAQQGYSLKTGNAGGLYIEMDGQRFGPLGGSGAVKRNIPLDPGSVRSTFTLSQAASLSQ